MKVVGFVPAKLNSVRLPRKNVLPLAGRPLVNWVLRTLDQAAVDETVLYASNPEILGSIEPEIDYRFVRRSPGLDSDDTLVQDFVSAFLDDVECDVVVLLHITSPFLSVATVDACIRAVVSGQHDSAFAALEIRRFAWFEGRPLNYVPGSRVPRTQDLEPVVVEQSGLYVFTRELFQRTGSRVGEAPYLHMVDSIEGHDIDTGDELELAEQIARVRTRTRDPRAW